MNNTTLQLKVRERLNKLASNDFDNIQCWQIVEAFNKGMIEWCRKNLHGINITKEGDEQSTSRIDDLQRLLTPASYPALANRQTFYETVLERPADYLRFKRISANAVNECCPDPRPLVVYLAADANTDILLRDKYKKPSFEFAETFANFVGNKMRIYTNGEFVVQDFVLTYYRLPKKIEIKGCKDPYTAITPVTDVVCEFSDDLTEVFIDEAVDILAGDIGDINTKNIGSQRVENNN